ncbi:hypothetical protein GA0115240_17082 [Streptomyces sp. DvalAA-14]|uniref:hypothetical protein n=1 Tax=unclassified Streptomyces TaxID=2593676 RepID=UPI00081B4241|nr:MULTISPECIES: hypothetical protein [unclassified Streptomyces]MYS24873.1 hypothetical protein [Streptomyces sp. SID4948]SCE50161.1 hypothetical protein GA0115240_17082 [Streptomyces sp. DvalAA-14]
MSRAAARRGARPHPGRPLPRLLSLPARLHLRWLVIAVLLAAAVGLYGRVLLTSAPMPPSRAPQTGTPTSSPPPRVMARG